MLAPTISLAETSGVKSGRRAESIGVGTATTITSA
jgi:hypothetical protein